jgi:hypothetical protein
VIPLASGRFDLADASQSIHPAQPRLTVPSTLVRERQPLFGIAWRQLPGVFLYPSLVPPTTSHTLGHPNSYFWQHKQSRVRHSRSLIETVVLVVLFRRRFGSSLLLYLLKADQPSL